MNSKRIVAFILLLIVLGCKVSTIHIDELAREADAMPATTMHRGVFYTGTDANCHYIQVEWEMRTDETYQIPISELSISQQMKPTKDKNKWRLIISERKSDVPDGYTLLFTENDKFYFIKGGT